MLRTRFLSAFLLALFPVVVCNSNAYAQAPAAVAVASFAIQVPGKPALVLTEQDLAKQPQQTVKVKEHDSEFTYTGASLHELLKQAGAPAGSTLHGKALASYVLATASDGYQAVYTLSEMDPGFTDDLVIVADRVNGTPLPDKQGPFRIVVARDKKPARSLRMLQKVEVVQLRP